MPSGHPPTGSRINKPKVVIVDLSEDDAEPKDIALANTATAETPPQTPPGDIVTHEPQNQPVNTEHHGTPPTTHDAPAPGCPSSEQPLPLLTVPQTDNLKAHLIHLLASRALSIDIS